MLEFLLCSLFTILPDALIKRYVYNKRWGKEINFYTMWYELRWGLTACAILTVSLITLIFYYHPATKSVTPLFRTLTILPEVPGRVEEVFVKNNQSVEMGQPLFRLDSSRAQAAVDTAQNNLIQVEAKFAVAKGDLQEIEGRITVAKNKLVQAESDYRRAAKIAASGEGLISERTVELQKNKARMAAGEVDTAVGMREEIVSKINVLLPAELKKAESQLEQAQVELEKMVVYAKVSGDIVQFTLKPGDIVNPLLRPAGLMIPNNSESSDSKTIQAGFNQLAAQVVKPGMLAEVTCLSKPFTIIPVVVSEIQPTIASGQLRPSDNMIDLLNRNTPGTVTVNMEPLYEGGLDGVLPGSMCMANAYSDHHDMIESGELGTLEGVYYHMVDAVGLVHALILRIQALLAPVQQLVFTAH